MSEDVCDITPGCTFGRHEASAHPCGKRHIPGSPCDYCGKPTPANGDPCWDCWKPITIADFKALMAEEGIETVVTLADGSKP
jgi:hypothetical protein